MFIPNDGFYYKDTSSGGSYSENPSGDLDIERFTNGKKDCFYQTTASLVQKKAKKIIFNNCYGLSTYETKQIINDLILQGFEVYQIHNDSLNKVSKSEDYIESNLYISNKKNRDYLLSKYHIEHDKMMLVDTQNLQEQLNPKMTGETIIIRDKEFSAEELREYLIKNSNVGSLTLTNVVIKGNMNDIILPKLKKLTLINVHNESSNDKLINASQTLQFLELNNTTIPQNLKNQTNLIGLRILQNDDVKTYFKLDDVSNLLSPTLIDLRIYAKGLEVSSSQYDLPALKRVLLETKTGISWGSFENLMKFANTPHFNLNNIVIKDFSIEKFLNIVPQLQIDEFRIDKIWDDILKDNIQHVLELLPNLKRVEVQEDVRYGDFELFPLYSSINATFLNKLPLFKLTHITIRPCCRLNEKEMDEYIARFRKNHLQGINIRIKVRPEHLSQDVAEFHISEIKGLEIRGQWSSIRLQELMGIPNNI